MRSTNQIKLGLKKIIIIIMKNKQTTENWIESRTWEKKNKSKRIEWNEAMIIDGRTQIDGPTSSSRMDWDAPKMAALKAKPLLLPSGLID